MTMEGSPISERQRANHGLSDRWHASAERSEVLV